MRGSQQNSSKQKKINQRKQQATVELQLSSDEQVKEPNKERTVRQQEKQSKIDVFLNRVKKRTEMANHYQQDKQINFSETPSPFDFPSEKKQITFKSEYQQRPSFEKARMMKGSQEIKDYFRKEKMYKSNESGSDGEAPKNLHAYFGERAEKERRIREIKKQKYEKIKEMKKEIEIEKMKEQEEQKKKNLSAIFDFMVGEKPKPKETLKNLDLFERIHEEAEMMKEGLILKEDDNRAKRNNVITRKTKLQPREKIPSGFIRLLLGFQFTSKLPSPETKRVPDSFEDHYMYKKIFHYLVTNECIADIHCKMRTIEEGKGSPIPIQLLSYKRNVEGMVDILINEIGNNLVFEEKQKFVLKNYSLSRNRIGIITNMKKFSLDNFGLSSRNKKVFAFLVLLVTPETKEELGESVKAIGNFQIPDLQLLLKANRSRRAYFYDLEKISTHIRQYQAISNLEDNDISSYILNPLLIQKKRTDIIPEFQREKLNPILQKLKDNFNETQYESIRQMIIRESGIVLLQGPPGTGKTTTLMGLIAAEYFYLKQILSQEDQQKILICAPSNAAVDHITKRLATEGLISVNGQIVFPKILRVGILESNDKDIRKYYLDDLCEKEANKQKQNVIKKNNMTTVQIKEKLLSLTKQRKKFMQSCSINKTLDQQEKEQKILTQIRIFESMLYEHRKQKVLEKKLYHSIETKKLQEADIILTTLSSSGSDKLQKLRGFFGCLIIDEAAQSTQPNLLIPLQTGVRKVLLVGDPCQLPSTTMSQDSIVTLFNRSLFERVLDSGIKPYFLNIQYRMAPLIREFSSKAFYSNRIYDDKTIGERYQKIQKEQNHELREILPYKNRNVIFIDTKIGIQEFQNKSYRNKEEGQIVKNIAVKFLNNSQLSIGIITPYQSQRKLLNNLIKQQLENDSQIQEQVEQGEQINAEKDKASPEQTLQRIMVNTVDSFQGQQKDIIIVSMVRSNENQQIGFMKDERRINVALTRSRHLLIVVGNGDTLGSNETWDKFLSWVQKKQLYYQIKSDKQILPMLKKVSKTWNKQEIERKRYKRLSKDVRKMKRQEIKKEDFHTGEPKKRVKRDLDVEINIEGVEQKNKLSALSISIENHHDQFQQTRQIIEKKRQKELEGTNYEEKIKKIKEEEQKILKGNSALSQLFQM